MNKKRLIWIFVVIAVLVGAMLACESSDERMATKRPEPTKKPSPTRTAKLEVSDCITEDFFVDAAEEVLPWLAPVRFENEYDPETVWNRGFEWESGDELLVVYTNVYEDCVVGVVAVVNLDLENYSKRAGANLALGGLITNHSEKHQAWLKKNLASCAYRNVMESEFIGGEYWQFSCEEQYGGTYIIANSVRLTEYE